MPRPIWPSNEEPTGPLFGDLRFVVAGTNRGGTQYFAALLREMGLRTKHEGLLTTERYCREYSRYWDCEVGGGNAHMLRQARDAGLKIIHLVRHPIGTINSIWDKWRNNDGFKKRFWIGLDDDPPAEAMGRWWMQHRKQIDASAHAWIHLEGDPSRALEIIAAIADYPWSREQILTAVTAVGGAVGARPHPTNCFTWDDLPREVQAYAEELGYC